ncbi:hypothetical protein ST41_04145 [Prevotella pectinovora]|nr:hypothetical protein ST41_04145 [Prevotella pectinovora]
MSVLHYDESVTELRFLQKRYSAIYKDFRNLSNSSPVQSFPNKRLWSLDFALEIVLRPLPRRTAILESDKSLTFIKRHIRKSCALIVHIEKRLSLKDGNSIYQLNCFINIDHCILQCKDNYEKREQLNFVVEFLLNSYNVLSPNILQ